MVTYQNNAMMSWGMAPHSGGYRPVVDEVAEGMTFELENQREAEDLILTPAEVDSLMNVTVTLKLTNNNTFKSSAKTHRNRCCNQMSWQMRPVSMMGGFEQVAGIGEREVVAVHLRLEGPSLLLGTHGRTMPYLRFVSISRIFTQGTRYTFVIQRGICVQPHWVGIQLHLIIKHSHNIVRGEP